MADNKFYSTPLDFDAYKKQQEDELLGDDPKVQSEDIQKILSLFDQTSAQQDFNADAMKAREEAERQNRVNEGIDIMEQYMPKPEQPPMSPMSQEQAVRIDERLAEPKKLVDSLKSKVVKVAPQPVVEEKKEEVKPQASLSPEDDAYDKAIAARDDMLKMANTARMASQFYSGATNAKYEEAPWLKSLEDQGKQKVADVSNKREEARKMMKDEADKITLAQSKDFNDPNSPISKAYRDSLAKVDPSVVNQEFFKNANAYQIKSIYPMIDDDLSRKAQAEQRKLLADEKSELNKEKQDMKDADMFNKLTDPSQPRNANLGKWQQSTVVADNILAIGSSKKPQDIDAATMYELARSYESLLTGGVGTVTGALHMIPANIRSDAEKVKSYIAGELPKAKQEQLVNSILDNVKRVKGNYDSRIQDSIKLRLKSGGAKRYLDNNKEEVGAILEEHYGLDANLKPIKKEEPPKKVLGDDGKEIKRKTAGGRVAVFDSETKKFLRYE